MIWAREPTSCFSLTQRVWLSSMVGVAGHLHTGAPSVLTTEARTLPRRPCQGPVVSQLAGLCSGTSGVTRVSQGLIGSECNHQGLCVYGREGPGQTAGQIDFPSQAGEQTLHMLEKHKPESEPGLKIDVWCGQRSELTLTTAENNVCLEIVTVQLTAK